MLPVMLAVYSAVDNDGGQLCYLLVAGGGFADSVDVLLVEVTMAMLMAVLIVQWW